MKRICPLLLALILFLTSCSHVGVNTNTFKKNDDSIADNTFEKVISAIKSQDNTQLVALFSKVVQGETSDLGENSKNFIKFIQGEIVSFSNASEAGVGIDADYEYGKMQKEMQSVFHIETSKQKYYIAIRECTRDDSDNNNVGVISIYIIKSEDWNEDYIYRGDGKWTPGINIDQKKG